ncbi:hypothetical protein [uncultured Clostridium sp.]|uniref:hypothetical protein n=1 Tax=uncultured Clostridium sp. TaxID=59620 RepID=UPI0028E1ADE8|nr:hypothetical protein [uncultured Clostridium sp.]
MIDKYNIQKPTKEGKTYNVRGKEVDEATFNSLRQKAVDGAWKQEKELVVDTGKGSRDWSDEEKVILIENGKVPGYEGQHMKSAKAYPDFVDNPDNIQFLKGRYMDDNEHITAHEVNYQNPTNWYYDPNTGVFVDFGDKVPWDLN